MPRRRRRLPYLWPVIVVIVLAAFSPWINSQILAVICAVLGGLLPVFVPRRRKVAEA
ncbi:hypothetical protein [Streptomyces sp. bgisy027]|uniref:hypothetical protein n=1 Tax=Streptomyces sp. bgisy027 TaxID=3413770 RepID=UPI003D7099E3